MAFNDLLSNQMVSFTDASSGGFALNSGQSNVTSNQCLTKTEALTKYNLNASVMNSYSGNQLVPKSAWITGGHYIGEEFAGGKIAYLDGTGQHGFILSTNSFGSIFWHATNSGTTGATGLNIGTGNSNTNSIVSLYGSESNAAKICSDSTTGGYTDWYLPSLYELREIRINRVALGLNNNNSYWSSSEQSSSLAWMIQFSDTLVEAAIGKSNYPGILPLSIRSF